MDIQVLVSHHLRMFEEIWGKNGIPLESELITRISAEYKRKLTDEIPTGACSAWVIQLDHTIVSSGAISIVSYVPNPIDISSRIALLHSIFTEKRYRNRGCASCIIRKAVQYCREQKIGRIYLFASDDGRPVYEKEGFTIVENMMRLYTGVDEKNPDR